MSGGTVVVIIFAILVLALRVQSYRLEAKEYYHNQDKINIAWLNKDIKKLTLISQKKDIEISRLKKDLEEYGVTAKELYELKDAYYGILYELELAKSVCPGLNEEIDKRIAEHFDYEAGVLLAAGPSVEGISDIKSLLDAYTLELTDGQRRFVSMNIGSINKLYGDSLKMQEG